MAAGWLGLAGAAADARAERVALELVLAVDASTSVDAREFDLQMRGLAQAFRDPAVVDAIVAAGDSGIAVTVMQWARPDRQAVVVPWTHVADGASAAALAARIERAVREVPGGGTGLGTALKAALRLFDGNALAGRRQVIDVSGDGRSNLGPEPAPVRDHAERRGITINALAIMNDTWRLDRYYRDEVIAGPGAFVVTAPDYRAYARAIRDKLAREIAGSPSVRHRPAPAAGALARRTRPSAR